LALQTVKNGKKQFLTNPTWHTAAILKNVKCNISAAVRPILMKVGMMMPSQPDGKPQISKFQNPR